MTEDRQAMSDIWTAPSEQVALRKIGDPIDWLPFEPRDVVDGEFVIREARITSTIWPARRRLTAPAFRSSEAPSWRFSSRQRAFPSS